MCPHAGMSPARWHRYLGTVVLIAMPRFPYRSVDQAIPACRQAPKALAQGLLCLLVHKERIAEMPWDTRSVVRRHTIRGISVWTHYDGRPVGERVRPQARSLQAWGAKVS
jgi:hypothetical protein